MTKRSKKNEPVKLPTAKALAQKGYSVTKAANACGVSPNHLSLVLRGKRKASAALVERLAALPKGKPVLCLVGH